MDRSEKVDLVASLHKTLSETTVVVVTQQTGMTVTAVSYTHLTLPTKA